MLLINRYNSDIDDKIWDSSEWIDMLYTAPPI